MEIEKFDSLQHKDFRIIMSCYAGSQLYGTTTELSDVDIRGVFIPTPEYFLGFLHRIEQIELPEDTVYYDIRKFLNLCLQCNPSIIGLLFTPAECMIYSTWEWDVIVKNRQLFLSKKARYTFAGYAVSQLHRIKRHRNWLLHPPAKQPKRSDFGLPEDRTLVTKDQLNAFDELTNTFNHDLVRDFNLDANALQVLQQEKAFLNANKEWKQYENWKKERNPKRAELETKFGYDTKHASHLYRLVTEGKELLLTGHITLPRPDANVLLDIRNGKYTYDELMSMTGDIDTVFDKLYEQSILPHKPDSNKADELCVRLVKGGMEE